jgi:hypothetical protein
MRAVLLALLLTAAPAAAQEPSDSFLPEATLAAAQARSAQQCQTMGCDGVTTVFWWGVIDLPGCPAGEFWIDIGSGAYGASGLTNAEVTSLVPYVTLQLDGCLSPSD